MLLLTLTLDILGVILVELGRVWGQVVVWRCGVIENSGGGSIPLGIVGSCQIAEPLWTQGRCQRNGGLP